MNGAVAAVEKARFAIEIGRDHLVYRGLKFAVLLSGTVLLGPCAVCSALQPVAFPTLPFEKTHAGWLSSEKKLNEVMAMRFDPMVKSQWKSSSRKSEA